MNLSLNLSSIVWPGGSHAQPRGYSMPTHLRVSVNLFLQSEMALMIVTITIMTAKVIMSIYKLRIMVVVMRIMKNSSDSNLKIIIPQIMVLLLLLLLLLVH